jgi:hypothetical protein
VTDQFSYTLSDGRGGSATGVVNIANIGMASASPVFYRLNWVP